MHVGKLVFAQVMEFAPWHTFRRLVTKYGVDFNVRSVCCLDQFFCMAFTQLTYRESLRDIEACLGVQPAKLYHLGLRGNVTRSNLADANELRDWRIDCDFAHALIPIPMFIFISDGKLHDVNVLDILPTEPEAFYVMDRGYLDFKRLHAMQLAGSFFVTRAKSNLQLSSVGVGRCLARCLLHFACW